MKEDYYRRHEEDSDSSDSDLSDQEYPDESCFTKYRDYDPKKEALKQYCRYCGRTQSNCLVLCSDPTCFKWFCTGLTHDTSHIIHHLMESCHKEVILDKQAKWGNKALICFFCKKVTNVFQLGTIYAKKDKEMFGIFCLECYCKSPKEDEIWDFTSWESIIEEKRFKDYVIDIAWDRSPQNLTIKTLRELEEAWCNNPGATRNDLINESYIKCKTVYDSTLEYNRAYFPLIKLEDEDRERKAKKKFEISVEWNKYKKGYAQTAVFVYPFEEYGILIIRYKISTRCKDQNTSNE